MNEVIISCLKSLNKKLIIFIKFLIIYSKYTNFYMKRKKNNFLFKKKNKRNFKINKIIIFLAKEKTTISYSKTVIKTELKTTCNKYRLKSCF